MKKTFLKYGFPLLNLTLGRLVRLFQAFLIKPDFRQRADLLIELENQSILDSVTFAQSNFNTTVAFESRQELWENIAPLVQNSGLILEFGVWRGDSINNFARLFPDRELHGFDSFHGLSENWGGWRMAKGTFDEGGRLPKVAKNVKLHEGDFEISLPDFLAKHSESIDLLHLDADTYQPTSYVLNQIATRLRPGSVLIFDEFFGYPNWRNHEFKAFSECVLKFDLNYEFIAFTRMQVAVQIRK